MKLNKNMKENNISKKTEHDKLDEKNNIEDKNKNKKQFLNDNLILNDLIYFKNDILKEINNLDLKINIQNNLSNEMSKKLILYNSKLEELNKKMDNFSNVINKNSGESNYYTEKIAQLFEFKSKLEQDTITQNCKIKLTAEELRDAINKYDRLINNNIIYPGIIGIDSKFKDYHEFIDYVLKQIQNFTLFKEKNIFDLKSYKNKLESNIKSINIQIQSLLNNANSYAIKNIKDTEDKFLNEIKLYDEKLVDLRIENSEFVVQMEKQNKEILKEWNNILHIKQSLTDLVEKTVENIKNSNNNMQKLFESYQEQINEIKNNYIELLNSLQDNKDIKEKEHNKINLNKSLLKIEKKESIPARKIEQFEEKELTVNNEKNYINDSIIIKEENNRSKNKIINKKMQNIKSAESILKQYIHGKSTLNELIEKSHKKNKKEKKISDNCPISIVTLVSFKSLYKDNFEQNIFNNKNRYKTLDDRIHNQTNNSFFEKNKTNKSLSNSPKVLGVNSSKRQIKPKNNDFDARKKKYKNQNNNDIIKNRDDPKMLLIKGRENNLYENKNKLNENEIKKTNANKDIEKYNQYYKNYNIRQLDDISFLIDNLKNSNSEKFPRLEDNKIRKIDSSQGEKKNKIRKRNSKIHYNKNDSSISFKTKKNRNISSEIIREYSNKQIGNKYLINTNKLNHISYSINNENNIDPIQKKKDKNKQKDKKCDLIIKGSSLNFKLEKNKK